MACVISSTKISTTENSTIPINEQHPEDSKRIGHQKFALRAFSLEYSVLLKPRKVGYQSIIWTPVKLVGKGKPIYQFCLLSEHHLSSETHQVASGYSSQWQESWLLHLPWWITEKIARCNAYLLPKIIEHNTMYWLYNFLGNSWCTSSNLVDIAKLLTCTGLMWQRINFVLAHMLAAISLLHGHYTKLNIHGLGN